MHCFFNINFEIILKLMLRLLSNAFFEILQNFWQILKYNNISKFLLYFSSINQVFKHSWFFKFEKFSMYDFFFNLMNSQNPSMLENSKIFGKC